MAVEKNATLPRGRYWTTVFEKDLPKWTSWVNDYTYLNQLAVRAVEHFSANSGGPAYDWVLFDVLDPTLWVGLGYPTKAGPEVKHASDVIQSPIIDTSAETALSKIASEVKTLAIWAIVTYGAFKLLSAGKR